MDKLSILISLTSALVNFAEQAQKISALLQKAQTEGREVSDAEWAALNADQAFARAALVAQLAKM